MNFTDLDAWKESRILVKMVYVAAQNFPREELYVLQSQIKRCVVSIPSNIAEGCGRNHRKDSMQFFYIARGSAYELETQLYLAFDLDFISQKDLDDILSKLKRVRILLAGLINYQKDQIA